MWLWIMAVVSAAPKPPYDELAVLVVAQAGQIAALTARVAELEARLNQNSRNSSKPPGSDSPFVRPAPKSLRKKGVRRPGRPDGQPGVTLEQVAVPDAVLVHEPEVCAGCGDGLAGRPEAGRERRQVIDLPQIVPQVTEHQLVARRCGCGQVTKALAPVGVGAKAMAAQAIDVLLRLKTLAEAARAEGREPGPAALAFQRIALRSAAQIGKQATAGRENKGSSPACVGGFVSLHEERRSPA